jgi:hypothetical protein
MCLQCACVLCVLVENVVCRSGPLRMLWCCSILICVPLLSLGPLRWIWTTYAQLALVLSGLLLNGGRVGQYVAQCLGPLSLVDFAVSWYSSLASPFTHPILGGINLKLRTYTCIIRPPPLSPACRFQFVPRIGSGALAFAVCGGALCILWETFSSHVMSTREKEEYGAALVSVLHTIEGTPNGRLESNHLNFSRQELCYMESVRTVNMKASGGVCCVVGTPTRTHSARRVPQCAVC